jgi:pimeloyl-ACP methyl ester carboxylesterase
MAKSGYIPVGNEKLHYLQSGTGKKVLLAFHGYGNNAAIFHPFDTYLNNEYTTLSFDLPHHGSSQWAENTPLTKRELVLLVEAVKEKFGVDKVSLLGYSMGGRVCLTIISLLPESIGKAALIATDGLSINFYYYFLTRTLIGIKLLRHVMLNPSIYLRVLNWLARLKLVHAKRHKFAMQHIDSDQRRRFLIKVWYGMSRLIVPPAKIKAAITRHHIPVTIFMGEYDRILPPLLAQKFKKGTQTVQVRVLKKGHRTFDSTNAGEIAQSLL